ncbi:MAG: D-alanyl-D-alanine carboxypeptidase (penicillin-binding protein 5/6) [Oceanospirillaceae bacterium]|jgi:D-alanyl-D-alanine carboxypeptidase (penicillin-binding protein 5/6)
MVNVVAAIKLLFCNVRQTIKHVFRAAALVVAAAMLLSISLAAPAQAAQALVPNPPQLAASAYILIDAATGKVIVENNADEVLAPASLTKMMTEYILSYEVASGNVSLEDQVRISEKAWRSTGSRMFIQEGTFVKLEDLMRGIVIQSGNDASVAVAEYLAGSEEAFADLMNQHALRLGMTQTHFVNSTGMPAEGHQSTARDLAILARAIIRDYPADYLVYAEKEFTFNKIRQPNRNKLLWRDSTVDGLKTGYTAEAGYCLVASSKKDGQRLISVVLGTSSTEARAQESQKLLSYGMRFFETHTLYNAQESLTKARVWGGAEDYIELLIERQVAVTIPRGQAKYIKATMDVNSGIEAPVFAGDVLGKLVITLDTDVVLERDLVAGKDMLEGGFFKGISDSVTRLISGE